MPLAVAAGEQTWSATFNTSSHIRMWDDDEAGVMYDASTGDTHFLNPVAMELLRLLSISPRTIQEMFTALSPDVSPAECQPGIVADLSAALEDALQHLRECGLASTSSA